ncbi:hypothetical protein M0P65_06970 [Candidatus Gracilibacteria bacterium]|jgi:ferritin|nr:hypothetical protein [Candidatus Gracilibacteria bacterium]
MYIGINVFNIKNYDRVSNFVVKQLQGKRQHMPQLSNYCYYSVNKIDSEDITVLNYYINNKIADIKILEYVIL